MKLYELTNEMADIRSLIEQAEQEEQDSGLLAALAGELDRVSVSFSEKVDGCAVIIREQNAELDAISAEISRLQARKKAVKTRVDWLREYVSNCITASGEKGVKTARFSVSVRPTKSVAIDNETALAEELETAGYSQFVKYAEPEIRRAELKKHMSETGEVFDHAHIEEKNTLYIK